MVRPTYLILYSPTHCSGGAFMRISGNLVTGYWNSQKYYCCCEVPTVTRLLPEYPRSDLDRGISVSIRNSGWSLCSDSVPVLWDSNQKRNQTHRMQTKTNYGTRNNKGGRVSPLQFMRNTHFRTGDWGDGYWMEIMWIMLTCPFYWPSTSLIQTQINTPIMLRLWHVII
jgi:hypothetical protein